MTRHSLTADFWGVATRILVDREDDRDHLAYYFEDFVRPTAGAAVEVLLRSTDGAFTDPAPGAVMEAWTRQPGRHWRLHERYTRTPTMPTPVPPFALDPLRKSVSTAHASAAAPPWDPERALVIHGASTTGKTCLLLELCRRGWGFVTDDTLVVRRRDRRLLRYCRPLGVREDTRRRLGWLPPAVADAPRFETPTGTTWCVSARHLGARVAPPETEWGWTALLEPAAALTVERLGPRTARLAFDVRRHTEEAATRLERLTAATVPVGR